MQNQLHDLTTLLYPAFFINRPDGSSPKELNEFLAKRSEAELDAYENVLETTLADEMFDFTTALPGTPRSSDELRAFAAKSLEQIQQWRATS